MIKDIAMHKCDNVQLAEGQIELAEGAVGEIEVPRLPSWQQQREHGVADCVDVIRSYFPHVQEYIDPAQISDHLIEIPFLLRGYMPTQFCNKSESAQI